ncbi:MAG: Rieske (2Fe-2S) protein [Ignavibacteriaceae bacterium]
MESCTNPASVIGSSTSLPNVQATEANNKITINIDSASPLAAVGNAVLVNFQSGSVLVDHLSSETYNALSSICTHQDCLITNFDSASNEFVCTCHGSRFDINGKVTQGPANSSLQKYSTQFVNNQLIINI